MILTYLVDLTREKSANESKFIEMVMQREETHGVLFDQICFTKTTFEDRFLVINVMSFESNLASLRNQIPDEKMKQALTTENVLFSTLSPSSLSSLE